MSVHLLDDDQVPAPLEHPRISGRSSLTTTSPMRLSPAAQGVPLVLLGPIVERICLTLRRPSFVHLRPSAALSSAAGATCSTGRPRRAATASGSSRQPEGRDRRMDDVDAFDEPSDLLSTSWMPAHSSTARTGPPAITPVPGAAGRSRTTPAAFSPWTGCGSCPGSAAPGRRPSWPPRRPWRSPRALPWPCRSRRRPCRRRRRRRRGR